MVTNFNYNYNSIIDIPYNTYYINELNYFDDNEFDEDIKENEVEYDIQQNENNTDL